MRHNLEVLSQVITWLVGPFALAAAMATYARQWPASYRRATGWTLAMLGGVLALSSATWLIVAHLSIPTGRGEALIAAGATGLLLAGAGLVRAVRAPVDPNVEALRAIASAVQSQVLDLDKRAGFEEERFVPLNTSRLPNYDGRQVSLSKSLIRERRQLVGLIGASGSGKTVSLRQIARQICHGVMRQRNPDLIALYVDLAAFHDSPDSTTADRIYSFIQNTIAVGNTTLSSHFARYARELRDRPQWIILFDSFDVLLQSVGSDRRDAAARQYLEAIRQFLSSTGPSFRGVVACRDPRLLESLRGSVLHLVPLSRRKIIAFSQRVGLSPISKQQLLQNVCCNTDLAQAARSPLLLNSLCDRLHQTNGSDFPSTSDDIVRNVVASRIKPKQEFATAEEMFRLAEEAAYYLVAEAEPNQIPDYDYLIELLRCHHVAVRDFEMVVSRLIRVGIFRSDRPRTFTFTHSCYQDHFAASWLLRSWKNYDLRLIATEPRWRSAAIAALQNGPVEFRHAVVTKFAEILSNEAEMNPGVIEAVASLTAIDLKEPLPSRPSFSFIWPPIALRILQMITDSLRHEPEGLPPGLRSDADRMIVSAFGVGLLLDQQQAIEVSAAATPEVALWAAERALASPSAWLKRTAARQLVVAPHAFVLLRAQSRIMAIGAALCDFVVIDRAFCKPSEATTFAKTLTGIIRDFVTIGQVTSWILALYSFKCLISDLASIPQWRHSGIPPGLAFWSALIAAAVLFLCCWTGRSRVSNPLKYAFGICLSIIAGAAAIVGIAKFIVAIIFLMLGPFQSAVADGVAAYILTWPVAIVARVSIGPSPTPWDWAFPQIPAIRIGVASLSQMYKENFRRRPIASSGLVGSDDGAAILALLDKARSQAETLRVLKDIAGALPGVDMDSANVLQDLARALEWVDRMVPANTRAAIPPGVWDVGPTFSSSTFTDWLRQFDKRHPGRLCWLAAQHREEVAQALKRAYSENL